MATQPVDRIRAKHQHKVAKRVIPALVNRSNKAILVELAVFALAISDPRFGYHWRWYWRKDNNWD